MTGARRAVDAVVAGVGVDARNRHRPLLFARLYAVDEEDVVSAELNRLLSEKDVVVVVVVGAAGVRRELAHFAAFDVAAAVFVDVGVLR